MVRGACGRCTRDMAFLHAMAVPSAMHPMHHGDCHSTEFTGCGRAEHAEHKHACDKCKQANSNHERQHTATHSCYRLDCLDTRGNTSSYYRGIGLWEISIYDKYANGMRIHHRSRRVGRTRSTTGMSPSAIIQRRKFERKGAQDSAQNGEQ